MMRILLLLEDYSELMFLQTMLKKIGFDVEGIQNSRAISDQLLSFNPDVLVMTAFGKRVRGFELAQQIKKTRGIPAIILIRSQGSPPLDSPEIASWLDSPVAAPALLDVIAELGNLDKNSLQDKLKKLRLQEAAEKNRELKVEDPSQILDKSTADGHLAAPESSTGGLGPSTITSQDRQARYKKYLTGEVPANHAYSVKQVQDLVRELRRVGVEDSDLERERKAFVEELFKKAKD